MPEEQVHVNSLAGSLRIARNYYVKPIRVAMAMCGAAQHATPQSTAQHPCALQHNATQV